MPSNLAPNCKLFLGAYDTGGAIIIGVVLDWLLFGILSTQIYIYYLAFPKDGALLKITVSFIYLLGMAQTAVAMRDLYNQSFGIRCPGRPFRRPPQFQLWFSVTASSALVALIAQWTYAYRIFILSKKIWVVSLIIALSLAQLASGVIGSLCGSGLKPLVVDLLNSGICLNGFDHAWGPLNVACDLTITICMTILLLRRREEVIQKRIYTTVSKLVQLTVETGLVTTLTVISYATVYNLSFEWFVVPGLVMSKIYSNSMLALLNNRFIVVNGRSTKDSAETYEMRSSVLRSEGSDGETQHRCRGT